MTNEMTPEEIRDIRVALGLTQVEAGELLGGGPRAFTKYESGSVAPSASVVRLLRILEADPEKLSVIGGDPGQRPVNVLGVGPFEVSGEHIEVLGAQDLEELLRRFLLSEAGSHGIAVDGIKVAGNIHAPDGGEDGRIEWSGGPERTTVLPGRLCQFQLKSGAISPAAAGREVVTAGGEVKSLVWSVLSRGGHYILACGGRFTQREAQRRKGAIMDALRGTGFEVDDGQVHIWDADQVGAWVNFHPSVAAWVRERTKSLGLEPFRTWDHWAGRAEHNLRSSVEDARLPGLRAWLPEKLSVPRSAARLVGRSGVGKSHLALEALGPSPEGEIDSTSMRNLVLYALESEASGERIIEAVQKFSESGARVVVVVDECSPELHRRLTRIIGHAGSRCSLLTIDYEIPVGSLDDFTYLVETAPPEVIQGIIEQELSLNADDRRRLERFSAGFPEMAIRVAAAWRLQIPIAQATDNDLVDAFVLGRNPRNADSLLRTATLVATAGLIQVEPSPYQFVGDEQRRAVRLEELSEIGGGDSADRLYSDVRELQERGALKRSGGFGALQPRPIALNLAGRQWRRWTPDRWDEVLGGSVSPTLTELASRQLALLNTTDIAGKVVAHACRPSGPFSRADGVGSGGRARALPFLAEIDALEVAGVVEKHLDLVGDPGMIGGDLRRSLVIASEKIAFLEDSFEDGALLLLRLGAAETERWGNNATEQFKMLFQLFLGGTAAGAGTRLKFLDSVMESEDPGHLGLLVQALSRGCATSHFSRIGNPGSHGSRPSLESWRPATKLEASAYIQGCAIRLAGYAKRDDELGSIAVKNLGGLIRSWITDGFIETAEAVIEDVGPSVSHWPEALEGLGDVLRFDIERIGEEQAERVRGLIALLQPRDVESRLRLLVTEMSWDFPDDEQLAPEVRWERQYEAVRDFARELVQDPDTLRLHLDRLSKLQPRAGSGRAPQRRTFDFGSAVAEFSGSPSDWLQPIVQSALAVPGPERDLGLLLGYVSRIATDFPVFEDQLKRFIAGHPELAWGFPQLCLRMGMKEPDVILAIEALEAGHLQAGHLRWWAHGGELAKLPTDAVGPLFDAMLTHSPEGYGVALDLIQMYSYSDREVLEGLRSQVVLAAERIGYWGHSRALTESAHDFSEVLGWLLGKGRADGDARKAALELARIMAGVEGIEYEGVVAPLLPTLLSGYPELVWPLLGQAVLSDPVQAWTLRTILAGQPHWGDGSNAPILSLPEDVFFGWCHANPEGAPAFAAEVVPILTSYAADDPDRAVHPVMSRLIDEFGGQDDVWRGIGMNLHTFGWAGSISDYFELFKGPLGFLQEHPNRKVRGWARRLLREIESEANSARDHDDEWMARMEL